MQFFVVILKHETHRGWLKDMKMTCVCSETAASVYGEIAETRDTTYKTVSVLQFHILHFHVLLFHVLQFHVRHFQRPLLA